MIFEKTEYLGRITAAKNRMSEAGLDLLIVADPANMNYLTGYDGWSFYVPQCVVVALTKEEPIWIGRGMDANGARHTTFLQSDNIQGYPYYYVQSPVRHPMDFVVDHLKGQGWSQARIGVELDAYYFTAKCFEVLKTGLPQAKFSDATLLVNWIRIIKSPQEIEYMKQAGKIAEKVMRTALESVRPGQRECDAVAAIYQAQISGTSEFGGDYTSFVPMMPTGEKTSAPHLTWTDEPYQKDQAVNLELAACRHRYHSPLARTVYLGSKPPQKLLDTSQVVVEGLEAALAAVNPGVSCESLELAWRKVIAKAGLEKESRIGYSMGLNYPPDWGEHTASLRAGDKTILRPNMTFHMILGMWMENWGFELSESFRVMENGYETFADFPRKLFIQD
ncbi:MAG: M24 family metallopeptidase [Deltaproteobacteria bacterium]|nr:M24 family metallopeptidase [Deltaproteobacteria bacterium]